MQAWIRWIAGIAALLSVLSGQASDARAQAAVCPTPAARKSVAVCFLALLIRDDADDLAAASAFLGRLAAQGKSERATSAALWTLIKNELRTAPVNERALRSMLRQHEPFYRAVCLPPLEVAEIKLACTDTAAWFQQGGACPSIEAFLTRPDVRSGRCVPAPSRELALSDSCRSAAQAGLAPDVERLATILQTPFGEDGQCRAEGLSLLCALRPEASLPVLNHWSYRSHSEDQRSIVQCLLTLMETQGDRVEPEVRKYLFQEDTNTGLLFEMLRSTRPADRGRLAPLVSALDADGDAYYWGRTVALLCEAPASARAVSDCRAIRAKRQAQLALQEKWRNQYKPQSNRYDAPLFRPVTITVLSVAIAGLHVGLSAHYRNDPSNLGSFHAYQGALGGAMLITGISVFSLRAGVNEGGVYGFVAAVLLTPIAALLAGVGGGYGGYRLGEVPGNGRVALSVASQSVILGTILGFTWGMR